MNNLELIETELGKIPVIVNTVIKNNKKIFSGQMIFHDMQNFQIETPTKASCLEGLKNAFELESLVWLHKQIKQIEGVSIDCDFFNYE